MDCSLPPDQLTAYIQAQLDHLFPDGLEVDKAALRPWIDQALARLDHSLSHSIWYNKRLGRPAASQPHFNHLHSDQQALFLAYLANTVASENGPRWLADKIYCLNKMLHSIDIGWAVKIPAIMQVVHGLGAVIGRATLGDYLMIYQGCTIGGSPELAYPTLGEGVIMYAGSRVIGAAHVGNNVIIGAGAQIVDEDIPNDSVVFGQSPRLTVKPSTRDVLTDFFNPEAV